MEAEKQQWEAEQKSANSETGQYLTFSIADQDYGIEIHHVIEIIGIQRITDLPQMPDFIRGVINLRGKVIPVVDARKRFGMEERPDDERTCIIVVSLNSNTVGIVVDRVSEVINIPQVMIEPPPKISLPESGDRFIRGLGKVGDEVKILLDIHTLLYDEALVGMIRSTA